jgi:hypothetical protein
MAGNPSFVKNVAVIQPPLHFSGRKRADRWSKNSGAHLVKVCFNKQYMMQDGWRRMLWMAHLLMRSGVWNGLPPRLVVMVEAVLDVGRGWMALFVAIR